MLKQLGPTNLIDHSDSDTEKFRRLLQSNLKSNNNFGFLLNEDVDKSQILNK